MREDGECEEWGIQPRKKRNTRNEDLGEVRGIEMWKDWMPPIFYSVIYKTVFERIGDMRFPVDWE